MRREGETEEESKEKRTIEGKEERETCECEYV